MSIPARPKPKYQVFISSTFSDLREVRAHVTWEVLKAGHIPVGMENFSAAYDRGWKVIEKTLTTTDYYVLILAGRYGSLDKTTAANEEDQISWTEREFNKALELKIPILVFIRDNNHITAADMENVATEEGRVLVAKLAAFKRRVQELFLLERWTTPDDLGGRVTGALRKQSEEDEEYGSARPGWYRGSEIASPDVTNELARLSRENNELRERLSAIQVVDDPSRKPSMVINKGGSSTDANHMGVVVSITNSGACSIVVKEIYWRWRYLGHPIVETQMPIDAADAKFLAPAAVHSVRFSLTITELTRAIGKTVPWNTVPGNLRLTVVVRATSKPFGQSAEESCAILGEFLTPDIPT